MNSVAEHYRSHLAPVYLWMVGGFDAALKQADADIDASLPGLRGGTLVVDLGCGFGAHALALARHGCSVIAIDSSRLLLDELRSRTHGLPVRAIEDDLLEFARHLEPKAHAILCMGDTLTHLPSLASIESLLARIAGSLEAGGRFVATFRDYTTPRLAEDRFILVRADDERLLSCFLEYAPDRVDVHDVLHERHGDIWRLSVSVYRKLRLAPDQISQALRRHGLAVRVESVAAGMIRIVATR